MRNRLFDFCVGETVGEKSSEISRKDPLINLKHFDTNLMRATDCEKSSDQKTAQKIDFTGVEIA